MVTIARGEMLRPYERNRHVHLYHSKCYKEYWRPAESSPLKLSCRQLLVSNYRQDEEPYGRRMVLLTITDCQILCDTYLAKLEVCILSCVSF